MLAIGFEIHTCMQNLHSHQAQSNDYAQSLANYLNVIRGHTGIANTRSLTWAVTEVIQKETPLPPPPPPPQIDWPCY